MLIKLLTRTCLNIKGLWLVTKAMSVSKRMPFYITFTLHLQIDGAPSRSIERHFSILQNEDFLVFIWREFE